MKRGTLLYRLRVKRIGYGQEVLVRENENAEWKLHWYTGHTKKGFTTAEGSTNKIYKYLYERGDRFQYLSTKDHIKDEIFFDELIILDES
jgi:hypothetical protein